MIILAISNISFLFAAVVSHAATSGLWNALKDAARHLIQASRRLHEANHLKSLFVARMSHDLRSPLNAIILANGLMQRTMYGPITDKQDEVLTRSLNSARRLEGLISDILDLSKLEAGQLELTEEPLVVQRLLEAIEATLRPTADDR